MVDLSVLDQLQKLSREIRGKQASNMLHAYPPPNLSWTLTSLMCFYAELDVGHEVPKIHVGDLNSLTFYRDYVSRNKPVIITGEAPGDVHA